jgi:hypothetical protein
MDAQMLNVLVGSYYGPRQLKKWEENRQEERMHKPRKVLLLKMLNDEKFKDGRKITTLSMVTGTTNEECRRLLIEIGARGFYINGNEEGWALTSKKPLTEE